MIDLPKIAQMLDSGWQCQIWKNELGSYTVEACHLRPEKIQEANRKILDSALPEMRELVKDTLNSDSLDTDDFTPEAALTRMAYKVFGEILMSEQDQES